MSGSETGVMMNNRDGFNMGLQNSPIPSQQQVVQSMRLSYSTDGTAVYKPVAGNPAAYHSSGTGDSSGGGGNIALTMVPQSQPQTQGGINMNMSGGGGSSGEQMKRKRGRPRKYGPDGTMSMGASPTSPVPLSASQSPANFTPLSVAPPAVMSGGSVSPNSTKKGRGRPPGPSKKPKLTSFGSVGIGFTPHVITVKAGEDVSSRIMSFSQNGPRAVCILSANGAISNVTLRQPSTSGGTVTYEGRFEILSLSGSFLLTENGGQRSRTGGLSVSLSGPDGRVLGGGVAGILTAATPVQVIVGSFIADGHKEPKPVTPVEPIYVPSKLGQSGGATGTSSPTSHGTLSESSGGPGSPINQSNNSHPPGIAGMSWK